MSKISEFIRNQVRQRAREICEYCHASEQWQYVEFTVDHVIPQNQGGQDTLDNLALACFHCNRRKATKTTAIDPNFGTEVPIFNPRTNSWNDHFIWSADGRLIVGLTATGRATITLLNLNRARIVNIRAADIAVNRHPPPNDPIIK